MKWIATLLVDGVLASTTHLGPDPVRLDAGRELAITFDCGGVRRDDDAREFFTLCIPDHERRLVDRIAVTTKLTGRDDEQVPPFTIDIPAETGRPALSVVIEATELDDN